MPQRQRIRPQASGLRSHSRHFQHQTTPVGQCVPALPVSAHSQSITRKAPRRSPPLDRARDAAQCRSPGGASDTSGAPLLPSAPPSRAAVSHSALQQEHDHDVRSSQGVRTRASADINRGRPPVRITPSGVTRATECGRETALSCYETCDLLHSPPAV
ncbi:hypothetical protein DAEQUDRAFT_494802 [Daedalea quercina L-15889]|uniref:Uncharacterized protein n=1 Tax=Daedalea quercina L-15889 TaxID=1314783 RepID=A0A165MNF3_9APHY|nr:hypothetical protein DAEQUDRAFT_494802 [Daedalea quercina L-15889]